MRIFTVGETVLDIISESFENVSIRVGGSMLNTAVSLGRLGLPVYHISYTSNDSVSKHILDFLSKNNVNIAYISQYDNVKTNLALAFLDSDKKADYTFYKNREDDKIILQYPDISAGDIVLFGSSFSLNKSVRTELIDFIKTAKEKGAIVVYDPNFRVANKNRLEEFLPYIEENIRYSNIIKGSDEDFNLIYGFNSKQEVYNKLKALGVNSLFYTMGKNGAAFLNDAVSIDVETKELDVISTIGAGDNFSAGIIYSLYINNSIFQPTREYIKKVLDVSIDFSSNVCISIDNYLSTDFCKEYINVQ